MALAVDSGKMLIDEVMKDVLPILQKVAGIAGLIGLIYGGKLAITTSWSLLEGIRAHFWARIRPRRFKERYGKWAVVTGCTAGIGEEYAMQLAAEGLNILLVSRSLDKLNRVSQQIQTAHGVKTEIVQADFNQGRPAYPAIKKAIVGKDIGILVNNVGVMLPHPMVFSDVTEEQIWEHVNVNMASATLVTSIILPSMLQKRRGAIINLSSIAASGPLPFMSIYAASKAYVGSFSRALRAECYWSGVDVQTVTPSYVSTGMTEFCDSLHSPGWLVPTPRAFVNNALPTIGYTGCTCGYWIHGIQIWFINTFVTSFVFQELMKVYHTIMIKGGFIKVKQHQQ